VVDQRKGKRESAKYKVEPAKRKTVDALGGGGKKDGYGRKNDTKSLPAAASNPQVEINGRPVGTAKARGSRTRHITLWVGLWVGNSH